MTCPCMYVSTGRADVNIDDPDNFHSCWIIWNDPMWHEELTIACLDD